MTNQYLEDLMVMCANDLIEHSVGKRKYTLQLQAEYDTFIQNANKIEHGDLLLEFVKSHLESFGVKLDG